ncbi:hypothetical protein G7Y89_g3599 [Cudoniella acicularis]|uniref:beta-glucosidase n=1 Tax=Cudoniella acicularis TaxID=354080 RepID=A0A8H4W879_9HELO|nr:hypothetical protein G7Y89_g3599 [Cudoniella acicularis]
MGGNFVKGVGSAGVIPSSKHFIMNEQEANREASSSSGGGGGGGIPGGSPPTIFSMISAKQSSNSTIKNGVAGAMCTMNKVNGTYSCENQDLLGKYLKVELGMPGIVHSDVGAQHTSINSTNAGMDYGSSSD